MTSWAVELLTWHGKLGAIRLGDDGTAVPDADARRFLDTVTIIEPDTLVPLTYEDGERYPRALPVVINGSAGRAVVVDDR